MKLIPKALAAKYGQLNLASVSEPITESFCDMALTIYNRLIAKAPEVFKMLLDFDEKHGQSNPLNSICKYQLLVQRFAVASSPKRLAWGVDMLLDFYNNQLLKMDDLTQRRLEGKGNPKVGLLDVINMKQSILQHMRNFASDLNMKHDVLELIRTVTDNPTTYRQHCGVTGSSVGGKISQVWRAGLPQSANVLLACIDSVVFNTVYDTNIMARMQQRASKAEQVCQDESLIELLSEVSAAFNSEHVSAGLTAAGSTAEIVVEDALVDDDNPDAFDKRGENQGTHTHTHTHTHDRSITQPMCGLSHTKPNQQ